MLYSGTGAAKYKQRLLKHKVKANVIKSLVLLLPDSWANITYYDCLLVMGLRQFLMDCLFFLLSSRKALQHMPPLSLSPGSTDISSFLSSNVLEEVDNFLLGITRYGKD